MNLSVSSIGTNELQRTHVSLDQSKSRSFSFLNRNERTATLDYWDDIPFVYAFQFPQSERTNCNRRGVLLFFPRRRFQFPQSERTNCNFPSTAFLPSILRFQFPQSERTNCNSVPKQCALTLNISFSFLNRNERTATVTDRHCDAALLCLSVSSIGTNELQLAARRLERRLGCSFSFLNRNERTATTVIHTSPCK